MRDVCRSQKGYRCMLPNKKHVIISSSSSSICYDEEEVCRKHDATQLPILRTSDGLGGRAGLLLCMLPYPLISSPFNITYFFIVVMECILTVLPDLAPSPRATPLHPFHNP